METLVLNAVWQPVCRIPWQRAITLLFLGKVQVVEEYEDKTIRAVTFEVKMPSVVRFLRHLKHRKPVIRFSRENVFARDHGQCQYCAKKVTRSEATYDHVVPRSQGGGTHWENIVIACVPCNQRKGGRTPDQAKMKLKVVPVKPTKLPDTLRLTFAFQKGMPSTWANWLRDMTYWHGSLEED
ncbi:MAG: HNH endonuclease [Archangium sp.]|nr:HNH endonuclease [Archangium sp.]MDP3155094.1 HNH endonuclease [Archangium sp.]MDP3574129.1 HNH endonuclease [Archangium sp.]